MINPESEPVAWAMLMYELSDASEHLSALIAQLSDGNSTIDEEDFAVQIGHIYAHLNRAWNGRNDPQGIANPTDEQRAGLTSFPIDLEPCG